MLGWSLGGEAHVFVADDRYARDFYHRITGGAHLADSLGRRPLISVQGRSLRRRTAQVLSASGSAPASIALVRFHAPGRCGYQGIVTEFVLAFPPPSPYAPPPHEPVVALLTGMTFTGGTFPVQPPLSRQNGLKLLNDVVARAVGDAALLRPLALDADQATDAGEIVPLHLTYGVGFRARTLTSGGDTMLVTGVASTDRELHDLKWVIKPRRIRLTGGMIPTGNAGVRYSLRAPVAPGGVFVLIDEIVDVAASSSRATARSLESGDLWASQPLALRCP